MHDILAWAYTRSCYATLWRHVATDVSWHTSSLLSRHAHWQLHDCMHSNFKPRLPFAGEIYAGLDVAAGGNDGAPLLAALVAAAPGPSTSLTCTCEHIRSDCNRPAAVPGQQGSMQPQDAAAQRLQNAAQAGMTHALVELLMTLQGPVAFAFWHASAQTLYFGRDALGRRSLLAQQDAAGLRLASCMLPGPTLSSCCQHSRATEWQRGSGVPGPTHPGCSGSSVSEVPPGLHAAQWHAASPAHNDDGATGNLCAHGTGACLHACSKGHWRLQCCSAGNAAWTQHVQRLQQQRNVALHPSTAPSRCSHETAVLLLRCLQHAVHTRCSAMDQPPQGRRSAWFEKLSPTCKQCQPPARVLVLFSGGLDSTLLAALAHLSLPAHEPIDLINVCFDAGRSPDRLSSLDAVEELAAWAPGRQWRLLLHDATLEEVDRHREWCRLMLVKLCFCPCAQPALSASCLGAFWEVRVNGHTGGGCVC